MTDPQKSTFRHHLPSDPLDLWPVRKWLGSLGEKLDPRQFRAVVLLHRHARWVASQATDDKR